MALIVVGLNHKTAPVDIRERITFGPDIIVAALKSLKKLAGVHETVILSTCNRTEVYCAADERAQNAIQRWVGDFHGVDAALTIPYLYTHVDAKAVCHLQRVSSGLDSLVLGEPQILGQVKTAFNTAADAGTSGKLLGRLFQHTFSVAKQVRTDTSIGNSPVSVAFAAVSLAKQIFSDLHKQTALLIGAGETIELAARHLHQQGLTGMIIANRTVARAAHLAEQFDGEAIGIDQLSDHVARADIIISSTASPIPVLGKGTVESALKRRRHQPIFMVDIAVPRDIEAEVGELDDVYLYTVDDLEEVIEENRRSRLEAAEQAEEIISAQTEEFLGWLRAQDASHVIRDCRQQAEAQRDEVLERALRMIDNGKPPEEALRFLANTLTNKLLHAPSSQLRQAAADGQADLLEAANTLFKLSKPSG